MNADEWREAVEELRDRVEAKRAEAAHEAKTDKLWNIVEVVHANDLRYLTALLNQDAADRVEEACPDCDDHIEHVRPVPGCEVTELEGNA